MKAAWIRALVVSSVLAAMGFLSLSPVGARSSGSGAGTGCCGSGDTQNQDPPPPAQPNPYDGCIPSGSACGRGSALCCSGTICINGTCSSGTGH